MEQQTKHSQAKPLSSKQIERAEAIEQREPLGIEYQVGDVLALHLERRFDVVTAIHLLHYLENAAEIELALQGVYDLLSDGGDFVTMIANPEFDLEKHDPFISAAGLKEYGALFFENYLANPQSKLLRLTKSV